MVGRPSPLADGADAREVVRFSHLERRGPQAGDPVQRLVLPPGLSGAVLSGRARPDGGSASAPSAAPAAVLRPAARAASVDDLGSDPRGEGVLLPAGYVEETREARSRSYKVVRAPDGKVLQSRPEAWRHYAAASSRAFQDSISGSYGFGGESPSASEGEPEGSPRPPALSPVPSSPRVAQPNVGSRSRSTRVTPSAGQPATPGPRPKSRGSRLRAELR